MKTKSSALLWARLGLCAGSGAVAREQGTDASRPSVEAPGSDSTAGPDAAAAGANAPAGAAPGAATEPEAQAEPRPTWYAQALAHGPGGLNVTQFWSKGSKLRAETVVSGHKIITLVNGDWYYAYDATKGLGIRIRRTPEAIANDAPYRRPFGNEAVKLIRQGAEKIREENFHGREAEVYQLTDRLGRRTVWATKDALNIPLRIEMFNRNTATRQATDFFDWLTGLTLPDSYFEVDPNVEVQSYEFEEYLHWMGKLGTIGPVPVLYADLLRGS
jgi:outer membrane lipoprotein-sorting protein